MKNSSVASASIKKELKKAFPGVKFSVYSPHYGTVQVRWNNGPTTKDAEAIANNYEEGTFNGMIDLYEYDRDRPETNGSARYVFTNRDTCPAEYTAMLKDLCTLTGTEYNPEEWRIQINGFKESATSIVNKVFSQTAIPAGHVITGLARTDCTCGLIEKFYTVKTERVTP